MRELTFLSWVGLKGAVPITLATFPMLAGLHGASLIFDTVFFVVLVSALVQGSTLPMIARYLKLEVPTRRPPPVSLEISSLQDVDADIVDYYVDGTCRAANSMVKDLALPAGVVVALIVRDDQIIPPQGRSRIETGDHLIVVLQPEVRPMVDRVFTHGEQSLSTLPTALEFPLRGTIAVGDFERFYGLSLGGAPDETLDHLMRHHLKPNEIRLTAKVCFQQIELVIREISELGTIEYLGMVILPAAEHVDQPTVETLPPADASALE